MNKETQSLIKIPVTQRWRRAGVIVLAGCVIYASFVAGRLFLGNAIGLTAFDEAGLQTALAFAPRDAQTHFAAATLNLNHDEQLQLKDYAKAVAASPNDYRYWTAYGQACERAGERGRAEDSFRRATRLAPAYSFPRWALGNLLLRRANESSDRETQTALVGEAFENLRLAGEADASLRPQIINLAWRYFDGDTRALSRVIGDTGGARAAMINYLIERKSPELLNAAISVWMTIDAQDKESQSATGARLRAVLIAAKRFRDALAVERSLDVQGGEVAEVERVVNGSFENAIEAAGAKSFGWQITTPPQTQIQIDPNERRDGARSLRMIFTVANVAADLRTINQIVVVEPRTKYRLMFSVRTQDLQTASLPLVEVVDANDAQTILVASSASVANGTREWQDAGLDFTTRANTEAVVVRLNRVPCADALCPIFGRVWLDAFALQRVS